MLRVILAEDFYVSTEIIGWLRKQLHRYRNRDLFGST